MKFRELRADEIDVRVGTANTSGISLLLYKNARCDMNILDETVGVENWQRSHEVIGGNLFCNVGIRDTEKSWDSWVWKQDVGVESYTEKEKGQASDSFKRVCFNWGIGRELYTAPFIWIAGGDKKDKFCVDKIEYENGKISDLAISKIVYGKKNVVFRMNKGKAKPEPAKKKPTESEILKMYEIASNNNFETSELVTIINAKYKAEEFMTADDVADLTKELENNPVKLKVWVVKKMANG